MALYPYQRITSTVDLPKIIRLMHHGKFELAIDEIDEALLDFERGSDTFLLLNKLKSKLYYYKGRGDQALYFINEVLQYQGDDLESLSYKAIYLFGKGDISQARTILSHIEPSTVEQGIDTLPGLSTYYFAEAMIAEYDREIENAIKLYKESLELKEMLDDRYESNIIYYKLATIERDRENITEVEKYLKKSLELSEELGLIQEAGTASTLLGQDLIMNTSYELAIPYLEDGTQYWNEIGSPFGIIWALGELAITYFLRKQPKQAKDQYREVIEFATGIMSDLKLSTHLINIIRFSIEAGDLNTAEQYFEQLKKLQQKTDDSALSEKVEITGVLIGHFSSHIEDQLSVSQSNKVKMVEISKVQFIYDIKIMLIEFEKTEHELFGEEIVDNSEKKVEVLLSHIQRNTMISFELHSAVLRSKLRSLNPEELKVLFKFEVDNERPVLELDMKRLDITSIMILLFLLPRKSASVNDLQNLTVLSLKHFKETIRQLQKTGLIEKYENNTINTQRSVFRLTSLGYFWLKNYLSDLVSCIEKSH